MWNFIKELRRKDHQRYLGGLDWHSRISPWQYNHVIQRLWTL